jgi:hypothetical protein
MGMNQRPLRLMKLAALFAALFHPFSTIKRSHRWVNSAAKHCFIYA